jgi:hypothetical protein
MEEDGEQQHCDGEGASIPDNPDVAQAHVANDDAAQSRDGQHAAGDHQHI